VRTEPSTAFKQFTPFTPREVAFDYVAFPLDNVVQVYGNEPQSFTASCSLPGFPSVTINIPANTYSSFVSTVVANAEALAAATAQANALLVCCYSLDPLPDTPAFASLSNEYTVSLSQQYGLLPFEDIAQDITPYVGLLHNWTMCPTCDFCSGPDNEGSTQPSVYTQRWFVRNVGGFFFYGKESSTENPVPSDLFTGITQEDIIEMSISFDANARPCFAFQLVGGTILLRRYVAGTPTFITFAGDSPKLFFDGVVQPDQSETDLVCFYVRSGQIKSRFQRDNFGIEYTQLAPSPPVVRITKTDAYLSHQNLYFIDSAGSFWLARSEVYPPFPVVAADTASIGLLPSTGSYTLIQVATGPYAESSTVGADPHGGVYTLVAIPATPATDESSVTALPHGGTYALVIILGGSTSDSSSVNALPNGGAYTASIVSGGAYTELSTVTALPGGGSYA
jgi:hypothetical protein